MGQEIYIIANPISGRGHDPIFLARLAHALEGAGYSTQLHLTTGRRDGMRIAASLGPNVHAVVSVGGDGTHNEIIHGLMGKDIPLAIVPSGTENVLGRSLGINGEIGTVVEMIRQDSWAAFDVGRVNGRIFIMFCGVGYDAAVTEYVHKRRRGPIRRSVYYWPAFKVWWEYPFPPLTVTVDGKLVTDSGGIVVIGNMSLFASQLGIFPEAKPDDGLLDVCIYQCRSRWTVLKHFLYTRLGRHTRQHDVELLQGRRIEVTSETPVPIEVDGDTVGYTPAVHTIEPAAVRLFVPPQGTRIQKGKTIWEKMRFA